MSDDCGRCAALIANRLLARLTPLSEDTLRFVHVRCHVPTPVVPSDGSGQR